ncbi:hypothetical protein TARUN_5688 [Trichoderma arundinaceum]|uniref:Uncharacterized protein n=1 Tax=Trichoderma arundinaceum TaxID=490622 RepID=A0A395NKU3_TRIAR|nr:hypothetical protein TARUN_5688 [Trichoderma arundinaceum]
MDTSSDKGRNLDITRSISQRATKQDDCNSGPSCDACSDVSLDVSPPVPIYRSGRPNYGPLLFKLRDMDDATDDDDDTDEDMVHEHDVKFFTVEVPREITREEVEDELEDILHLLRNGKDTCVTAEMAKRIDLEHVKVLCPVDKSLIRMWAKIMNDARILVLIGQSPDDLDSYKWVAGIEHPLPLMWSINPAFTVWNDMRALVKSEGASKLFRKKLRMLRVIFQDQAKRSPDVQTLNQIAELRREISALKGTLSKVHRQNDEIIELLKENSGKRVVTEQSLGF